MAMKWSSNTITAFLLAVTLSLMGSGCATSNIQETDMNTTEEGNFVLYVNNKWSEADSVDINIYINDKVAVSDYFYEDKEPRTYKFDLKPGKYDIKVKSSQAEIAFSWEMKMKQKRWGYVEYWGNKGPEKQIQFTVYDSPLSFD